MAIQDGTSRKRESESLSQNICTAAVTNPTYAWYLADSKYHRQVGNSFRTYLSGEEVFNDVAKSIRSATKSIDIISWGFDPAMPIVRSDDHYKSYQQSNKDAQGNVITYSPWQEKDTYGDILLKALEKNPQLEIRIIIWYYAANSGGRKVQNLVGLGGRGAWHKQATIDRDARNTGYDPELYDPVNGLKNLPLRHRHPRAQAYSREWFKTIESHQRIAFVFRDIKDQGAIQEEDDRYQDTPLGEKTALSLPTDHQKTILIDFEDDGNRHGYVMGHNSKTEYWSEFPFKHRSHKSEMDYLPYHDFSIRIEGPLTVDINRNFLDAWESHNQDSIDVYYYGVDITKPSPKYFPQDRGILGGLNKKSLREKREPWHDRIKKLSKGKADGQIVRTRPDEKQANHKKEIKDAYMQATRHVRNYSLIVNQYCQYAKLIRHMKYWKQKAGACKNNLYIFMGSCRSENDGQVFRAHRMANELGLGDAFEKAEGEMYNEDGTITAEGGVLSAPPKVNAQTELTELGIYPLYFSFYTQAPKGQTAQEVYVHAKLMVLDDAFFTMGSANLNIRSMAVDSELNLISTDLDTTQNLRKKLFDAYGGVDNVDNNPKLKAANKAGELEQEELEVLHDEFKKLAKNNLQNIKDKETIAGHVVQFTDDRGVVGVTRQG